MIGGWAIGYLTTKLGGGGGYNGKDPSIVPNARMTDFANKCIVRVFKYILEQNLSHLRDLVPTRERLHPSAGHEARGGLSFVPTYLENQRVRK